MKMERLFAKTMCWGGLCVFLGCGVQGSENTKYISQALGTQLVAAIQFDANNSDVKAVDPSCASEENASVCAVKKLITQAQAAGAILVVTPEYGLGQEYLEPDPTIGETPAISADWPDDTFIKEFSKQANELQIYLVINLQTYSGSGTSEKTFNTQVAFGPDGKVVGVHHKFELFDSEADFLTPGVDVMAFDTPLGKVGLLICADMYGDLRLHDKLTGQLGAKIVAVSSFWTANGGYRWPANFAKNWGVFVISSNTTAGEGQGGGIFDPDGTALDLMTSGTPGVASAAIPTSP
ncbi:MAG: carbon-nitrogen hydrolase family protein [Pseudomonadota bacterium]